MNILKNHKLILGSTSPRREQLLKGLDLNFRVEKFKECKEEYPDNIDVYMVPEYLSLKKSECYTNVLKSDEILITADTIVILNNLIIGKPLNQIEAKSFLKLLSGHKHTVVSGVTIRSDNKLESFTDITNVWFKQLSEEEIEYYVSSYDCLDKAGAYGAQDWIGFVAIEKIEGSFFNVMGLPVHKLFQRLKSFSEISPESIKSLSI